jgi:hypothetical protein
LQRVFCQEYGFATRRELIHAQEHCIIDAEDDDMLIDYEQFSRMLLGTALI